MLITPFSWGSQLVHRLDATTSFLVPLLGIEEDEAPTSTTHQWLLRAIYLAINPWYVVVIT
jgi:hypothetical protein